MNDKELRAIVLSAMRKIESDGPEYPRQGICHNVEVLLEGFAFDITLLEGVLVELFESWPHYNGVTAYPIGNGSREFYAGQSRGVMWYPGDDYGALRWDLLRHCIRELEK